MAARGIEDQPVNKLTWGIAAATASTLAIVAAVAIPWPKGFAPKDGERVRPNQASTTNELGLGLELVDAEGKPVQGARVLCAPASAGANGWSIARPATSNQGGMALLVPISAGMSNIAIVAPGRAAQVGLLDTRPGMGKFALEPGSDLVVKLSGQSGQGQGQWLVAVRPLDAGGECATRFASALDALEAFEAHDGRGANPRTDDGASLRRADDQGTASWSGLPRCTVLVEAWLAAGGDSFLPAQGTQVHRQVVDLSKPGHDVRLSVATRTELVVEVLDGGMPAAAGTNVLVASWNEHDSGRDLMVGRVDAAGMVVFRSNLPANGSNLVAYANLGARWAVTNALRCEELGQVRLELPPADAKPLSIRCVDADGKLLQPTHLEVLDAGPLAAHGLPHARMWMSEGESTSCPVVNPHGSMRVAAVIDSKRHAGLRTHAIAEVQPGVGSVDLVFPPASPAAARGSVEFAFEGLADGADVSMTCQGAMQRDWRGSTTNGTVVLSGFAPGASGFVARTSDGRVARGVVEARAGETTKVRGKLERAASFACELGDASQKTHWTLLGCDDSGAPTIVLAEGDTEAGQSTIRVEDLPAGSALLLCTRGSHGSEGGEQRTLTSARLEVGSNTTVAESNASAGARVQLDWPADMQVRLVTFELQPEGASKLHVPVAWWSTRLPAGADTLVVPGLPKGRWTVVAWPHAGAEGKSGQATFFVDGGERKVRLER